jgi:tellurite resistance protein TerC
LEQIHLFPFAESWWMYGVFLVFVCGMLALDLGVFHREAHEVSVREAAAWSAVWVALSLAFNYGLYHFSLWHFANDPRLVAIPGFDPEGSARTVALEFLAGYLVEKALSVDNIFVMVVLFSFFGVPAAYQHRVLFYGILGALVFRGIFVAAGSLLMRFEWVIWVFGGFLILTGLKMLTLPEKPMQPGKNPVIKLLERILPVTSELTGQTFFTRISGKLHATPLLLALAVIETTDIVFAVDSVPAIFALTKEPLIVFTSNIFAVLGLRALYFMLRGAIDKFHLLKYGLAVVLIFVGLKMVWLNEHFGGKFPIGISLGVIATTLLVAVLASLLFPRKAEA